jgi:hypothetical protein
MNCLSKAASIFSAFMLKVVYRSDAVVQSSRLVSLSVQLEENTQHRRLIFSSDVLYSYNLC